MKMFLYSVKDTDFAFSQPCVYASDALALRAFVASCRAERPNICNTSPEKKVFCKIGEFDDTVGALIPCEVQVLARAIDHVLSPEEIAERDALLNKAQEKEVNELRLQLENYRAANNELQARINILEAKNGKCRKNR